jgi:glutaconate CoA-transferase subunit A
MKILDRGDGELVGWHDPDEQREWVKENKTRALVDKRMDLKTAVSRFVSDGALIAMGGFGHIRVSFAGIYEIVRQGITNLTMLGKTAVHDIDVLIGAGAVSRVEVAYAFGHELRGLSPAGRRAVESGKVKVVAELSNGCYQWRFLGGMMGIPFIPTRNMLGTDTFRKSSAIAVEDPFSKKPVCLVPSVNPDIVFIHVPRCDKYGNCQIDGTVIEDFELSRAARRLIVTTEEIIDNEKIRKEPWKTVVPFFLVDAVVEVKYGAHPVQMPYAYFFDEEHIGEWLELSRTEKGTAEYFEKYVYGVKDFKEYIELVGGPEKMKYLHDVEFYLQPMKAPWLESKRR